MVRLNLEGHHKPDVIADAERARMTSVCGSTWAVYLAEANGDGLHEGGELPERGPVRCWRRFQSDRKGVRPCG